MVEVVEARWSCGCFAGQAQQCVHIEWVGPRLYPMLLHCAKLTGYSGSIQLGRESRSRYLGRVGRPEGCHFGKRK
jgi:hypothetical protein